MRPPGADVKQMVAYADAAEGRLARSCAVRAISQDDVKGHGLNKAGNPGRWCGNQETRMCGLIS